MAHTPQCGNLHTCASHCSPSQATLWASLLILVPLFWGNTFIAIKHIVEYVTPLELVAVRFLPTALVFAALLLPACGRQAWQMDRAEGWGLPLLVPVPRFCSAP